MAGHKRPNGTPVCPKDTDRRSPEENSPVSSPSASSSPSPPPLRRESTVIFPKHYENPNFVEQLPPRPEIYGRPADRVGTPNTWVSTEPADDIFIKHETMWEGIQIEPVDDGLIPAASPGPSSASSSSSSSSASSLRRTFTNILRNSRPVASLFSAPRDEVDAITQEARQNGLFTGLIHRPRPSIVKQEPPPSPPSASTGRRAGGLERTTSWWVVLGHSAEAVGHLLDMQDRSQMATVTAHLPPSRDMMRQTDSPVTVGAYPVDVQSIRNSYLDIILGGMVGGFIMFYLLCL